MLELCEWCNCRTSFAIHCEFFCYARTSDQAEVVPVVGAQVTKNSKLHPRNDGIAGACEPFATKQQPVCPFSLLVLKSGCQRYWIIFVSRWVYANDNIIELALLCDGDASMVKLKFSGRIFCTSMAALLQQDIPP